MYIYEEEIEIPAIPDHLDLLDYLRQTVAERLKGQLLPVRFTITETRRDSYKCELGVIADILEPTIQHTCSIFDFQKRASVNNSAFNVVLLIPTGIGSTIGGHAGDANPVAKLLASACDTLITHPNVVNASDINELPDNGLYVEGSIISRLMMGTIGLQPVRANRVLAVVNAHPDKYFTDAVINTVSAARASCGLDCPQVIELNPPVVLESLYASSGRAVGRVSQLESLTDVMDQYQGSYDAVAISTQIDMPINYHTDYYLQRGDMINPWGGVEAIFTHSISSIYDVPTAHAPLDATRDIANLELGVVDPRMAAEIISSAYFLCVLKGLQRAPKIIKDIRFQIPPGILSVADVSCLVIPDGCIGLPTLAALEQGIPVIAVRENKNIMKNNLSELPWQSGQLHIVENYWEAVGVMSALKAGVLPASVRRPLSDTTLL
ncbi:MAG: high light inducible protein [Gammaproteobacteria bacterium SG8_15]|nr:MAG: high light inducible protein [Gammaproteobacteria bacterium SG8_15]